MERKLNRSFPPNTGNDKEIIKKILLEKESDTIVKDKMYRIIYEVSSADDISMDTDLIDECVKTIDLIEGNEEHIPSEKIKVMRQNVDQKYKDWQSVQKKIRSKKNGCSNRR